MTRDISDRVMFGIFLDVTQRKQAEEASALLAGEMSHRVKNLLQIASALTQITSRSTTTKEEMAHELTNRLMALGRAQELVRPVPGRAHEAALLGDLISILLAPYDEKLASVRIRVSVPKLNVGEASSTTLALVIHELATNSAKYGALSTASGTVDVSCNANNDEVVIVVPNAAVHRSLLLKRPRVLEANWFSGVWQLNSAAPFHMTGRSRAWLSHCE